MNSVGAIALALRGEGAGAVETSGVLGLYDAEGNRTAEAVLPAGAAQVAPFAEGWLVRVPGTTSLVPSHAKPVKGKPPAFADGGSDIHAFAMAVDGVAVARAEALELWTHAGKLRWSVPGTWVASVIVPGHVVGLAEDGTLVFALMRDGTTLGTLRLASTEPPAASRLAPIAASGGHPARVVLSLGEWLVWIDVTTQKAVRRVRARDNVTALGADAEWVVCATESGWVQAFSADCGEPGGAFEPEQGKITSLALGRKTLFVGGTHVAVRAFARAHLAAEKRMSLPVTALAARGRLLAIGDCAGNLRIVRDGSELISRPLGETVIAAYFASDDAVVAATTRVVLWLEPPWTSPRPIALRAEATSFTADEDYAFAGTEMGTVDVYDLRAGTHVTSYALSDGDVTALARLPGKYLAVGTGALDGRLFIVDVTEPKVLHRLKPHDDAFAVTCLACDRRGRIVASGGDDGSVVLIDPAKGKLLARLRVRETPVSLAFDATGRRIACAFADGTASLLVLGPRGVAVEEVALPGTSRAAWGDEAVFGLLDGRVERLTRRVESETAVSLA